MKGGTLWRQKNFRKKVAQCRKQIEKIERGGCSVVASGFVGYPEKVCTKFALASLPDWAPWVVSGLFLKSGPISVRLKKKKVTAIVGHFSLKGKRAD